MPLKPGIIQQNLLAWYDASRRALPWRALAGESADPYRVWLSEIMLQQTVVATVIPYFQRFTARWPSVQALADAKLDDVLTEWAGLGYYARARNLHKCALVVARDHGGVFPSAPEELLKLPGIGAYTAGAIASIAFGLPFAAVDGNVERVTARLANVETPLPAAKPELRRIAESLVPQTRAGDFAQAMMDLGGDDLHPHQPQMRRLPTDPPVPGIQSGPSCPPAAARGQEAKADTLWPGLLGGRQSGCRACAPPRRIRLAGGHDGISVNRLEQG